MSGRTMDCLEVTLMWSLLMRIALILLSSILGNVKKIFKKRRRSYLPNTGQQGYQQGCQQGRELSVSVVLVEQLKGGQ